MRPGCFSIIVVFLAGAMTVLTASADKAGSGSPGENKSPQTDSNLTATEELYEKSVKPLLMAKCSACHGALKQESGLRLDAAQLIRAGGESGPAIVAGNAAESLLLQRISEQDESLRMPPADSGHPLKADEIEAIRHWIAAGAVAADEPVPADPRDHWSYHRPQRPQPTAPMPAWGTSPIDQFLHAHHQTDGLHATDRADRNLLLRRLSIDLTGLPPTPAELHAFLADDTDQAWSNAVDRLLASPRYGQRWARHWMDVWRYSDPSGYGNEIRDGRQHIWRWRDWIVDSLNNDLGYDQMIIQMLAADEAVPDDLAAQRATGYLARNWYKFNRNVWLDNIVEHSSKAFLGMTVNCSRCHDHKYDPLEQHEYYSLRAIFETHDVRDDPSASGEVDLVRAYDAHLDRPTYPFIRGDENRPDEDHPLAPALPEVLPGELHVQPVELPVIAWYPAIRPSSIERARQQIRTRLQKAREELTATESALLAARTAADAASKAPDEPTKPGTPDDAERSGEPQSPPAGTVLVDPFEKLEPERWKIESGTWETRNGRLLQSDPATAQHRILLKQTLPRDFSVTARVRITGGEMWRSVGVGFDGTGKAMKTVYLSAFSGGSKAQFSLQDSAARWSYPNEGTAPCSIELNKDYTLTLLVRDTLLNVRLDDRLLLAYRITQPRQPGELSLWAFSATAEFDELRIQQLDSSVELAAAPADSAAQPPTPQQAFEIANRKHQIAQRAVTTCEKEYESFEARVAAEQARYGLQAADAEAVSNLAAIAARSERAYQVARLQEQLERHELAVLEASSSAAADDAGKKAAEAARKKLEETQQQLAAAQKKLVDGGSDYSALGPQYPRTSSGRRLAYARWLVDPANPLTARVAVNHVWMRMVGRPLVERVFDFGLRSERPVHQDLLDWLAVEFVESGWSLKALHRQIALSGFYQLSSAPAETAAANADVDPDNRLFWRMNVRRLEAEAVRDSVLFLGEQLDEFHGGPPIEHTQGQTSKRRSLYFRQDKERQMTFLSLFDGANVNECYERKATVVPQQALAMFNSQIAAETAQRLTSLLGESDDRDYVDRLFERVLCRAPLEGERQTCLEFLTESQDPAGARRNLALVLLNHNDFVSVR